MRFIKSKVKPPDESDEFLLQAYRKSHDMDLLATLFQKYMHLLYGLCLKYLNDEEAAKDAVMQIFEQLVDKVLLHNIKNFKSWLYVLARNYCLMQLRAGKKFIKESADELMEFSDDEHHYSDELEEDLVLLDKCKQKLPNGQRVCVHLFFEEQKCYKEIADETGYSLNEVKSYIQNGKRNLKICIEKHREH